jgi:hypothetical protein
MRWLRVGKALTGRLEKRAGDCTREHTSERVMLAPNRVDGGINSIVS